MTLEQIKKDGLTEINSASNLQEIEALRIKYLGKSGLVTLKMGEIGKLAPEERKEFGANINKLKEAVSSAIDEQKTKLEGAEINAKLKAEAVDVTLPVRAQKAGKIHPISHVIEEITSIFASMGFKVEEGPEIEDDFHNFTALNIPENHPARQMQDTFYMPANEKGEKMVLRTHTSPVQIRTMENGKPPFKFIAPGRVYRSDYDMTHTPMFHQVEGLYIDKNINMGHLKFCLHEFLRKFFELDNVPLRFRPSFFPFTEPSAEVDIGCSRDNGEIKIGGGSSWLEILGCGMVNPNVLKNVGIDPEEYQGFAFGLGIERLAMLKYGIPDLRQFFDSDVRWLDHYSFNWFE